MTFAARRLKFVAAAAAVLAVSPAAVLTASWSAADIALEFQQDTATPCPSFAVRVNPSDIHLEPGVVQHQSWLEFSAPRRFAGTYALCLDGRSLSTGGGRLDFHDGFARFNVSTRSVDLYWLAGGLDALRDPSRWELRLECAPNYACG